MPTASSLTRPGTPHLPARSSISIPNSPAIRRTKSRCRSGTQACQSVRTPANVSCVMSSSNQFIASQQSGVRSNNGSNAAATTRVRSAVGSCWSNRSFSPNHWASVMPGGNWAAMTISSARWRIPDAHDRQLAYGGRIFQVSAICRMAMMAEMSATLSANHLCGPFGLVLVVLLDGAGWSTERCSNLLLGPIRKDIRCLLVVFLHAVCKRGTGDFAP